RAGTFIIAVRCCPVAGLIALSQLLYPAVTGGADGWAGNVNILLNEAEARVLGALIEKDITTPDYYPLSLNSLINACNQKNNRDPVMTLDESTVREAL